MYTVMYFTKMVMLMNFKHCKSTSQDAWIQFLQHSQWASDLKFSSLVTTFSYQSIQNICLSQEKEIKHDWWQLKFSFMLTTSCSIQNGCLLKENYMKTESTNQIMPWKSSQHIVSTCLHAWKSETWKKSPARNTGKMERNYNPYNEIVQKLNAVHAVKNSMYSQYFYQ